MSETSRGKLRRLCFVSTSRADYGLLSPLIHLCEAEEGFSVTRIATGSHLSPEFGMTVDAIAAEAGSPVRRIEMLLSSDSRVGAAKSLGVGVLGFAEVLEEINPDLLIVLGDRYELLAPVSVALILRVPVAHIHGGELTEGAIDDSVRHAVTKMSALHFAATEEYGARIVQMGEPPEHVHVVGALGIDNILSTRLLDSDELYARLGVNRSRRLVAVTYHPETRDDREVAERFGAVLRALDSIPDATSVITRANADAGGRTINAMTDEYVATHAGAAASFASLGQQVYLSLLKHASLVIGNSSSGIIEAPSFRVPTVNIGDRQKGRVRPASVVDARADAASISAAVETALSAEFRVSLDGVRNPYGDGHAAERIVRILSNVHPQSLVGKTFHDMLNTAQEKHREL
jgi:UDP-hydrolysing UDP-N-acetyl-D-glucosamine 2-epimerase